MQLSKFKTVDKRSEFVTFGYIRQYSHELRLKYDIPTLIMQICTIFYYITDEWDETMTESYIRIIGNKLSKSQNRWSSAFLSRIVDKNNGYKHHWRFKIIERTSWLFIGIWDDGYTQCSINDKGKFNQTSIVSVARAAYCFDCVQSRVNMNKSSLGWEKADSYGKKTKSGDIVDMHLDFESKQLSFCINNVNLGKAHDIRDGKYRGAISIAGGDKIELVSYQSFYK